MFDFEIHEMDYQPKLREYNNVYFERAIIQRFWIVKLLLFYYYYLFLFVTYYYFANNVY